MTRHFAQLLARFDPVGLDRYGITARDLETIEKYIHILQSGLPRNVWDEALAIGGEYGTSILIHEIVQIRGLIRSGVRPLRFGRRALSALLGEHLEVHVAAVHEEHLYLQDFLVRKYGQRFEIATLIRANRADERDLEYYRDGDIGVYLLEEERVQEARAFLARLKGR